MSERSDVLNPFIPDEALRQKLTDALVPGYEVECTPEEADAMGAFEEDAISEADAEGSTSDWVTEV